MYELYQHRRHSHESRRDNSARAALANESRRHSRGPRWQTKAPQQLQDDGRRELYSTERVAAATHSSGWRTLAVAHPLTISKICKFSLLRSANLKVQ